MTKETQIPQDPTREGGSSLSTVRAGTSRYLLWGSFGLAAVLLIARSRQLYTAIDSQVRDLDLASEITEPGLLTAATNTGFYLGLLVSVIILALYFSLADVVDQKLLPGMSRRTGRKGSISPASLVAIASVVPLQAVALIANIESPRDSPLVYAYLTLVVAVVATLFIRTGRMRLSRRSTVSVYVTSIIVAALSLAT